MDRISEAINKVGLRAGDDYSLSTSTNKRDAGCVIDP